MDKRDDQTMNNLNSALSSRNSSRMQLLESKENLRKSITSFMKRSFDKWASEFILNYQQNRDSPSSDSTESNIYINDLIMKLEIRNSKARSQNLFHRLIGLKPNKYNTGSDIFKLVNSTKSLKTMGSELSCY